MTPKELKRIVKRLQRQSRMRQPKRKNFYFDQKGVLGKGVVKKYSGSSINELMKKFYGKSTRA
tara:strand:- start:3821 stop:4009 length:189 start_codon:yes stop_codon:yes gene_type:complete